MKRPVRIIAITTALLVTIFYFFRPHEKNAPYGSVILPDDIEGYLVEKWNWAHSYDPYDEGKNYEASASDYKALSFNEDGTFEEISTEEVKEGVWMLNKQKDALALVYGKGKVSGDLRRQLAPYKYRYKLKKLTDDSLVMAIQGRHGFVIETYLSEPVSVETQHAQHEEG